ncbi:hypothetical protein [Exiguobacterium artemiae]|nr:hypothetical protein [Exiguobacterium sibiricum]
MAKEAVTSSALSNNHIHDLIDLANEYENLKNTTLQSKNMEWLYTMKWQ